MTKTMPNQRRSDRGSLSLETVILMPAVLLIVFGLVQGAVWLHARNVATSAANDGAAAARAENASPAAGVAAAESTLSRNAESLREGTVAVDQTATTVTVTVTGRAAVILTDWKIFRVSQSVTSPRERVTSPEDN